WCSTRNSSDTVMIHSSIDGRALASGPGGELAPEDVPRQDQRGDGERAASEEKQNYGDVPRRAVFVEPRQIERMQGVIEQAIPARIGIVDLHDAGGRGVG